MQGPLSGGVMASANPYTGAPQSVGANVSAGPINYAVNQPTVRGAPMSQTVSAGVPFDANSYFGVNATRSPGGMQYGANVRDGGLNAYGQYNPQNRGYAVGAGYQTAFAKGGDVTSHRPVVGHTTAAGEPISLEQHKGDIRMREHSGASKMAADYGYLDASKPDHDGARTDVFVGPHKDSKKVFVVNQQHPRTGKFNEHKVLLGYHDRAHALRDYAHSFSDGQGHKRIQSVVEMGTHQLKDWLKKDHKTPLKMAEGGDVDVPRPLTIRRGVTPQTMASQIVAPEEQGPIDGRQAASPSPEGVAQGIQTVGEGVVPLAEMTGSYLKNRFYDPGQQFAPNTDTAPRSMQSGIANIQGPESTTEGMDPSPFLQDVGNVARMAGTSIAEDPAGAVGSLLPGVGLAQAGASISDINEAVAQAEAVGNRDLANKLRASASGIGILAAMPGGSLMAKEAAAAAKAAAKAAVKDAAKAGTGQVVKGAEAKALFKNLTGREHGTAPTDIPLLGRGDMTLPDHVTPETFANEVQSKIDDVKQWNNPQRRFWYENSGDAINTAVGGDPEMADRLTLSVAKTSQGTPVLDNASYSARAHHQIMAGDPVSTGKYPAAMSPAIQDAYATPEIGAVGPKISGYQSGFRSAWLPQVLNAGANDIHNMRWMGWDGFNGTPTTGQHNYDRMVRSSVADRLNAEGFDNGGWQPGQVQAVGWAKSRAAGGVPEAEAGYDLTNAFADRTGRLTYETAPGLTTNHLPEYHDAPFDTKQAFHDAMNNELQDPMGRDIIASHMGLLTLPTEHGLGVYQNNVSPGSAARVVTGGGAGGWSAGIDPSTAELMKASELTRGLLLRQDASAYHFPAFPKSGMTWNDRNIFDVKTGAPMTLEEAKAVNQGIADRTGSDFFSPIFTKEGYRFLNVPEYSGVSNKDFANHLDGALNDVYSSREAPVSVHMGHNDGFYQPNDWSKNGGADYLEGLRTLRPDVQRRAAELLATLGPRISKVEDAFAATHGWTPDPSTRIWETNPAYAQNAERFKNVTPGVPPKPQSPDFGKQPFDSALMNRSTGGAVVGYANGGSVNSSSSGLRNQVSAIAHDIARIAHKDQLDQRHLAYLLNVASGMYMPQERAMHYAQQIMTGDVNGLLQRFQTYKASMRTLARLNEMMGGKHELLGKNHMGKQMQRGKGIDSLQRMRDAVDSVINSDVVKSRPVMAKALGKIRKRI
jgi:hypothetical protein